MLNAMEMGGRHKRENGKARGEMDVRFGYQVLGIGYQACVQTAAALLECSALYEAREEDI